MDQDETRHGDRPWPWPQCLRWEPSSPPLKGTQPPILAHVFCGQMARWIKMPFGTEVGLGPGHIVLDGYPAPPLPPKGHTAPAQFSAHVHCGHWPHGWMDRCHLVRRSALALNKTSSSYGYTNMCMRQR